MERRTSESLGPGKVWLLQIPKEGQRGKSREALWRSWRRTMTPLSTAAVEFGRVLAKGHEKRRMKEGKRTNQERSSKRESTRSWRGRPVE